VLPVVDLTVGERSGFYVLAMPNGVVAEGTARHLIAGLHGLTFWDYLRLHADWPLVHGASVLIEDQRLLLIGAKGSGKSTLALHLLARGHRVEGDEHLAIGPRSVIARPRSLRIKSASLHLVGPLPQGIENTPTLEMWDGRLIHSIDPSIGGRPWMIGEGPLRAIILLEPNHDGRSFATRASLEHAFAALMANSYIGGPVGAAVARLRSVASAVPAFRLRLGELSSAEWQLRRIAT
jgi:hypothetical protein